MLKCSICEKKITNKEDVKFTWRFLIYPRIYCSNKCLSAARKIDPYLNYNQGQPIKLKSHFILILIITLIMFVFSAYVLINYFWINLSTYTVLLWTFIVVLWIVVLNVWRMHFWARRQMNQIK
jgi:hypothetical protein